MDSNFLFTLLDVSGLRETQADDIRTEYHPSSNRPQSTVPFEDFGNYKVEPACAPSNSRPWHPWRTRTDFEIAALSLECSMNEDQTTKLMGILNRVVSGRDKFTLKDYKEIQSTWDLAAERSTKV